MNNQAPTGVRDFARGYASNDKLSDAQLAAEMLKRRIESLSECYPMWSRSAYTHRRTFHVAFRNGAVAVEGEEIPPNDADLFTLADATFAAVKAYRDGIAGDVGLVWRCEPEVRGDVGSWRIYTRLCFEPVVQAVAA